MSLQIPILFEDQDRAVVSIVELTLKKISLMPSDAQIIHVRRDEIMAFDFSGMAIGILLLSADLIFPDPIWEKLVRLHDAGAYFIALGIRDHMVDSVKRQLPRLVYLPAVSGFQYTGKFYSGMNYVEKQAFLADLQKNFTLFLRSRKP